MIQSKRPRRLVAGALALATTATLTASAGVATADAPAAPTAAPSSEAMTAATTAGSNLPGLRLPREIPGLPARNVILIIGDGMSDTQIMATRYLYNGRDTPLAMETVPHRGRAATFSNNDLVTDSAAAASAMGSGTLADNGALNVSPEGQNRLRETLGARAKQAGKRVGLISTRDIANATPAGFASAVPNRGQQNEIAAQYLDNRIDVLLGGGDAFFTPAGQPGPYCPAGRRTDGNLYDRYRAAGYTVTQDRAQMLAANQQRPAQLLGVFGCTDMNYDLERTEREPTITEMTDTALRSLERNRRGFFLMVEGGMIDPAAERNDAVNTMGDTRALDGAVRRALDFARNRNDTLVVITGDHEAGGMNLVFGNRVKPIAAPTSPVRVEDGPGRNVFPVRVPGGTQEMRVNFATNPGHTGAPVPVRAVGPGAQRFDRWLGTEHLRDLYGVLRESQVRGGLPGIPGFPPR